MLMLFISVVFERTVLQDFSLCFLVPYTELPFDISVDH